jgi:putative ABC transport system ATP-binding protein
MTDDTITITASFPIYKPFRKETYNYKRNLNKMLRSINKESKGVYKPNIEELNQFIFCSSETDSDSYLSISERKSLETILQKSYSKFASQTLDKIKKMVAKDPEYVASVKAIKDLHKNSSVEITEEISHLNELPAKIRNQVRALFKDSQMILWDLPGNEIDRIIIGHDTINFEDSSKDDNTPGDIGNIADELALASLAKNHVPLLSEQINIIFNRIIELESDLEAFETGLNNFKDIREQSLIVEVASVFLGKLLGIREPISLAQKIMARYMQLEKEICREAEEMDSDMVRSLYNRIINSEQIKTAIQQSEEIMNRLTNNAERIRNIYVKVDEAEITGKSSSVLQEFASFVAGIYHDLEHFRFITELFQDIPSYTAMGGSLVTDDSEMIEAEIAEGVIIHAEGVFKTFPIPSTTVYALRGIDLEIKKGEFIAIMGPSGSGKTTLLNILSGIEEPDRGFVHVAGLDLIAATEKELTRFRRDTVSFIYQSYNLLPNFTNRENVQLPADLGTRKEIGDYKKRSTGLLIDVGLEDYIKGSPLRLSGGEQQRVTIARSLMNNSDILFADEPTGDLDTTTGRQIMDIIESSRRDGVTIVLVTHDKLIAERADRIIYMQDGVIGADKEINL